MTPTADKVTLSIPRDDAFVPILHMLLGGIGLRRNLSFDSLDDLQLAVDSILSSDQNGSGEELLMTVLLEPDHVAIVLEGLKDPDLRQTLVAGHVLPEAKARCIDVCFLLRSLIDGYEVAEGGEGSFSITMRKSVR
ncbi:MAG TPA: hypothetical protein VFE20_00300 [Thermoleophilia bacterium]|nr:hypothetical protein [Thermoleophilia bacterium]